MVAFFPRFTQRWANVGLVDNPTNAQADAGFQYLGPAPPSVEGFNSLFQWNDEKDTWLYHQIGNVIEDANIVPAENDLTALLRAINAKIAASTPDVSLYVRIAGDSMTGSLNIGGVAQTGISYSPPAQGGAWGSAIGFGWDGTGIRAKVDGNAYGVLAITDQLANYVAKAGDIMTGPLTATQITSNGGQFVVATGYYIEWNVPSAWWTFFAVGNPMFRINSFGDAITIRYLQVGGNTSQYFLANVPGVAMYIYHQGIADAWSDRFDVPSGVRDWNGAAGVLMRLSATGNLTVNGGITCPGHLLVDTPGSIAAIFRGPTAPAGVIDIYTRQPVAGNPGHNLIGFFNQFGGAAIGAIWWNGAGQVELLPTSDYRLKQIHGLYTESGNIIDNIPVHLVTPQDAQPGQYPMFLAHEVQEYVPWTVSGEKDAVNDDGEIIPQMMGTNSLIPIMWQELRDMRKRIKDLERRSSTPTTGRRI